MAATGAITAIPEQNAAHPADPAWWWDGSRWQPASTEIPVGGKLRARLRLLSLPLTLTPGVVGPLLLLPIGLVLFIVSAVAASGGYAGWRELFLVSFSVPVLALPLAIMRAAMGFGVGALRHDLAAKTFWRTQGRPVLTPSGAGIGGRRLRPRLDARPIRAALATLGWAEVDHGVAGAAVFAIRDRAGNAVYGLKSIPLKTVWFAAVAALALLWTLAVSQASLGYVNQLRFGALSDIASAEKNLAALTAAKPCESGHSTRACYLVDSATITRVEPRASRGGVSAICAASVDTGRSYELATDCDAAPPSGSKVTVRSWDGKVVDINYQGQVIDTVDSPQYELAAARRSLEGADSFRSVWAVAPVLYLLLVGGGNLAWHFGAARRHARYARATSRAPA